jgi:hypothetical protein
MNVKIMSSTEPAIAAVFMVLYRIKLYTEHRHLATENA